MSEPIEACDCGYDDPKLHGIPGRWRIGCSQCGRCGPVKDSHDAIAAAWNADMKAIKAARNAKPEPRAIRSVFPGEWFSRDETIYAWVENKNLIPITSIQRPDGVAPAIGHQIAANTTRIMATAKEMHRKLAEGRALYRDGYSSTSLSEFFCSVGVFLDGLGVDVD